MGGRGGWKAVRSDWREVVLVCRKCSKKLGGGFGPDGDRALGKSLRRALTADAAPGAKALRRSVAVVEVGCLDLCPKGAVVVVRGSDPRSMLLVPKGAGMDEALERLGLRSGRATGGAAAE